MARRFDAVLFDLDDTLWHFDDAPPPAEIAAAMAPRIEAVIASWGEQRPAIGYAELDLVLFEAQLAAEAHATDHRVPDLDAVFVRELGRVGVLASHAQARQLRDAMLADPTFAKPRLFEGVTETLDALKDGELRLAAVTDRSHAATLLAADFEHHGLHEHFDVSVTAGDTGWRKPHPASIERALASLGVRAQRAAMVGDQPSRDIAGARAAGVTAVLVRHSGRPERPIGGPHEEPHLVVGSIAELTALLGDGSAAGIVTS
jgi:putative hydrolase of the HAD superfamily